MKDLMYDKRWEKYEAEEKGIDSACKKCGCLRNPFAYHDSCYTRYAEHLHFTCGRCGYDWTGPTLDQV